MDGGGGSWKAENRFYRTPLRGAVFADKRQETRVQILPHIRISHSFSLNLTHTHTTHKCPSIRRLRRRYLSRQQWPFSFRCCSAVRSSYLLNWEKPVQTFVENFARKIADAFRQQLCLRIINDALRRRSLLFLCFAGMRIYYRVTRHHRVSHAFLFPRQRANELSGPRPRGENLNAN